MFVNIRFFIHLKKEGLRLGKSSSQHAQQFNGRPNFSTPTVVVNPICAKHV